MPRDFLDEILQLFQRHDWKDQDGAADAVLTWVAATPERALVPAEAAEAVPSDFLSRNKTTRELVEQAFRDELEGMPLEKPAGSLELITIDDIDSFALVRDIDPARVKDIARPLRVNERVIKHCIHHVIGDPYVDEDWGGERADIGTARVQLSGARKQTAFLLKGRSVTGPLYGSELGTRGDQIVRLMEMRAELSVVQHVNQIPAETQDQLRYGVIALRATGAVENALGSAWDGVDTGRLLLAASYIDEDANLTAAGQAAEAELGKRRKL